MPWDRCSPPACLARSLSHRPSASIIEDFQLQVEHALDLDGRERVLFVDASVACASPFEAATIEAAPDAGFTTHALSPQAVLQVYRRLYGRDAPPATLLAIRGLRFELGEGLTRTPPATSIKRWHGRGGGSGRPEVSQDAAPRPGLS